MKRVLSLVLALVLVLGMIPTFAAGTGADHLKTHGFISGNENGDLLVNVELTREMLAALVLELNGEREIAAIFEQPAVYADSDEISAWAVPFVAYAQEMDLMTGVDKDGQRYFLPQQVVTGPELAAVLMKALGYSVEGAAAYATVLADAAELGIVLPTGKLTRGVAFEAMWVAVSEVPMNGSDVTLGVFLGRLEPEVVVPTELVVSDVVANNLKTLVVEFNKAVNEDTITATNVKVTQGTTTLTATRSLSEDGKTLSIVLASELSQSTTIKLAISKVKDLDGKEVVAYEKTMLVNDTTVPTVLSAVALNPRQIKLQFSEPVALDSANIYNLYNNIKVDGTAIIAKAAANYVDGSVLLTLSGALTEGTKTVEVSGVKDFAEFTAPTASLTITVVKDETAPEAISAVVKSKTVVEVTFNEPVETPGVFKINNSTEFTATSWRASNTVAVLTVPGSGLDIGAVVEVKIEYKNQKDIMNNEVKEWKTILTKVADDSTIPTVEVTSVAAITNKLTLTFSKGMADQGSIALLNKNGATVATLNMTSLDFKANTDSKVLEVTFSALADVDAADYSVKLTGFADNTIRSNALPTTTLAFKALDTKNPTVAPDYVVTPDADDSDDDTITIYFSEAMDPATIESVANYYMGSTPFSANAAVVSAKAATDGKSVVIGYENARALTDGASTITVYAVKDVAGNVVDSANNTASKGTTANLSVTSVEATDVNTIEVKFNTTIKSVQPSTFVLVNASNGNAVASFVSAEVDSDDPTLVVFTTGSAISTSASIYELKVNASAAISNIYNRTFVANYPNQSVTDLIAPTLVSVTTSLDSNGVAINNQFKLTFSEGMSATIANDIISDIIVKNSAGAVKLVGLNAATSISVADKVVTITLHASDLSLLNLTNGNKTLKVSFPVGLNVEDQHGNNIAPVADQDVTVKIQN